jgi:ketosteroid isomerase-like protein
VSRENLDTVRLAYDRLNGGDLEGLLELCAEDLVFHDLPTLPGSGEFIGHAGFRAWYAGLLDAFESLRFEAQELIEVGDRVFVDSLATGRGKGSGAKVEMHFCSVWTLRDQALISHTAYSDRADGLAAAKAAARTPVSPQAATKEA